MPRPGRPEIRHLLVGRAAEMLARREPVTLRTLVAGTGVSPIAVYTYFDGMPGLWSAVRQQGFLALDSRLSGVGRTDDAVADLAAIGGAYVDAAMAAPHLYRAMFDGAAALADPQAADATFDTLRCAVQRAVDAGRFHEDVDAAGLAAQLWTAAHGVCILICSEVLGADAVQATLVPLTVNLYVASGDDRLTALASMHAGWRRAPGRGSPRRAAPPAASPQTGAASLTTEA